jgi:uncharacterized surface protein with fasciclin (FAS1) repeats
VAVTASAQNNIVDEVSRIPQLSTLVSLVVKANLVGALQSNASQLIIFAPTNQVRHCGQLHPAGSKPYTWPA